MTRLVAASVAASGTWTDDTGIRQPAGEVHAWHPGTGRTLCGLTLSGSGLTTFPHVPFDHRITAVITRRAWQVCPRCATATGRAGGRPWTRASRRP